MKDIKRLNLIMGWVVFAIALVVYALTLESNVSLWDCGEFASAAYRLQVVHPPGAPLFLMVGRLFSMLAGADVTAVGFWTNMVSGASSAGCVMFTFWITTYFAERMVSEDNENRALLIMGAGLVAALTNTFIDSFWFSAVESEVYALSSFFTALSFWAILKWWKQADEAGSDRWIVFIGFLVGLALGTHMLNLLVIPAVCLAYYFRKYSVTRNGIILALGSSALALGFVMKIVYPGIPWLLARMDRLFVNDFGMSFYSGTYVAVVLVFAIAAYLLWYTNNKGKVFLNTLVLAATFVVVGYSSYAMVIIRSLANPAIDMNNPEDPYKFYGYITREQYGDRPLAYGPFFNAPEMGSESKGKRFFKGKDKYEDGGESFDYTYPEEYMTLFPRMGKSNKPNDDRGFREFGGMGETQSRIDELQNESQRRQLSADEQEELQYLKYEKPSFGNNLTYFFNYQIRYMYLRYFMWNFVGRFNDQQANMGNERFDGNWYSGIPFIDHFVVGPRDGMPDYYKNQKAQNTYFFLPLFLGILGLMTQAKRRKLDFWLVMTLFLFTGLLINVYMNQPPYEPRERDYALVGSFQTFCIWVGLGVIALAELLQKRLGSKSAMVASAASVLLVPVNMAYQNWDDHDRSGRYIGIDMAKNFLNQLDSNAVLFCNGDNDTYPLWYAQNVEGIRTDVRIINQSLLPTDWYSSVLLYKVYDSDPLPLTLDKEDLQTGSFENGIVVHDEGTHTSEEFQNYWGELRVDECFKKEQNLSDVVARIRKERRSSGNSDRQYLHGDRVFIPINKQSVLNAGVLPAKDAIQIEDTLHLNVGGRYISKGDLLVLDLISQNAKTGWKRPIYFTSVSGLDFYDLNNYLQLEGLVYKFVPINGGQSGREPLRMDEDKLYNNLVKNYRYYGMKEKKNFFLDEKASYVPGDYMKWGLYVAKAMYAHMDQFKRIQEAINKGEMKTTTTRAEVLKMGANLGSFATVGDYLTFEAGQMENYKKKGVEALRKILVEIPESVMPMRRDMKAEYAMAFMDLGADADAKKMLDDCVKDCVQYGTYFQRWEDQIFGMREVQISKEILEQAIQKCERSGHADWAKEVKSKSSAIL